VVERLAVFLMFFDGIKSNMVANRVCTYLSWVMVIVIYIYVIVALFIILVNMKRKYERKENGTEAKENA
jgi:heme/copper-type cytochrome/quinol oxidase subunit 2